MTGARTFTPLNDWGYDKIIRLDWNTAMDRITITYDPHREYCRRLNRIFNDPPPSVDTSNQAWIGFK